MDYIAGFIAISTIYQTHMAQCISKARFVNDGTIQIIKNDRNAWHFHIPEYFDVKGEKLNLLMEMIEERVNMLYENELKRSEMYKRCLWTICLMLPLYIMASVGWIIANIFFYKKQRQKLKKSDEANNCSQSQERERLLERYNQIPPPSDISIINRSPLALTWSNEANNEVYSSFEMNRARVEAILKRNNEPQFMRRI
ncbi:unnamed protein product [Thelazia callipaeda]|uniref:Uncharacterized protein n=1 Tax=Thelazia callipaeda TaxID=103827 RepID=A0A0N5CXN0_THECL|nr:unnamed protein product [Thelazia callipaeda]